MSTNTTIPEDFLRAAHKLGCDIRHHIAHSEIELIQHDVAVDLMIAKAIHDAVMAERENADRYKAMFEDAIKQHNAQMERAEAAEAAERDQWQDISTAPKDGTAVDLWGVNHLHPAKTGRRATDVTWGRVRDWMGNERDDWQHGQGEDFEPTHWMPLPAAPKGDK